MENKKDNESINIKKYINLYKANWKFALGSVILIVFCAIGYLAVEKKSYQTNATILIRDNDKGLSAGNIAKEALMRSFGSSFGLGRSSSNVDDEEQIIGSYSVLKEAISDLGLETIYSSGFLFGKEVYYKNSPMIVTPLAPNALDTISQTIHIKISIDKKGMAKAKATIGEYFLKKSIGKAESSSFPFTIKTLYGDFSIDTTSYLKKGKSLTLDVYLLNKGLATEILAEEIAIKVISKKTNTISLSTTQKNKRKAEELLAKIIEIYDKNVLEDQREQINTTIKFVQERLNAISEELSLAEKEIEVYKKDNKLSDVEIEAKVMLEKNGDFKEKLIDVETQLNIINMVSDYVSKEENRYNPIPNGLGIEDIALSNAILEYNTALIERARLLRNTNEKNPILINMNEQVDIMREAVVSSINNVKRSTTIAKADLDKEQAAFYERLKGMPTQEREYIDIKRNQLIKEQLFLFLLEKREENALMLTLSKPKTQIIDFPYTNVIPVSPKPKIVLLAAFVLGLLLPLLFILYKEFLGKVITSEEGINDITSIPVLTSLDLSHTDKSFLSQMIQLLVLKINRILPKKESSQIIAVTSDSDSSNGDLLSYLLACGYARLQQNTLLIDINYRSPGIQGFVQNAKVNDLYKFLTSDGCSPEALIQKDAEYEYLDFISIMRSDCINSELLSGSLYEKLIKHLQNKYRYIILRVAPLNTNFDAFYTANITDALLFLCKEGKTLKTDIERIDKAVKKQILSNVYIVLDSNTTDDLLQNNK